MIAYYNENDAYPAQWLRNLIVAGLIAPGEVDERSIRDVSPDDLRGFTQCHFFAGIGIWSHALRRAGWEDNRPLWTGSCPCQPFSVAGKRAGFTDDRHLWPEWFRLIRERRPAILFGEQVASAAQWLNLVRSDLEGLDYAVGTMPVEAASAGAFHLRDRYWFVGTLADGAGQQMGPARQPRQRGDVVDDPRVGRGEGRPEHELRSGWPAAPGASREHLAYGGSASGWQKSGSPFEDEAPNGRARRNGGEPNGDHGLAGDGEELEWRLGADGKARPVKPGIRLLVDGRAGRVDMVRAGRDGREEKHEYSRVGALRGLGNAIDPRPAAAFIEAVMNYRP